MTRLYATMFMLTLQAIFKINEHYFFVATFDFTFHPEVIISLSL